MIETRTGRKLRANHYRDLFFATADVRRNALLFLPLLPLFKYGQASRFTRGDVMAMARERIEHYTSPFFNRDEDARLFFYQLEDRRAWIVGSVALAALSFSCDLDIPDNLNVISSVLTEDAWVTCMRDHLGYTIHSANPCVGFYAKLARRRLVFRHKEIRNKTITVTISRGVEIFELFLRARTTLMANAISAQEMISTYADLTSNLQGISGYTPAFTRPLDVSFEMRESPFPGVIELLDDTATLGRPCGLACPGRTRISTDIAGIGHWAWGGMKEPARVGSTLRIQSAFVAVHSPISTYPKGMISLLAIKGCIRLTGYVSRAIRLIASRKSFHTGQKGRDSETLREHPLDMASLPDPAWPAVLHTKEQLVDFLYSKSVRSLATDIFNVEFHLGVYGSYAADETACTDDQGDRYSTFIFGRVINTVGPRPVFRVDGGSTNETALHLAFSNQVSQLAAMVKEGDEADSMNEDFNIDVHACTDSCREDGSGGTWIEIDVGGIPVFRDGPGGLVKTIATRASDIHLNVGDWVLYFYVNADAIRVLDFDSDVLAATDDDTLSEESMGAGLSEIESVNANPGSASEKGRAHSTEDVVESSDTDELNELGMAARLPDRPADETLLVAPVTVQRASPSEEEDPIDSGPVGLKRERSASTEATGNTSRERNDAPATPVRKRGRTARMRTGRKAPPKRHA
ncbi:hypothetical protein DFH08DRAFT_978887 [Mycena albidolilacea]|uniref:Uncharacterized protein n=2 Tax=Mycena albidolilacea TaxID=1033008 RepID=A0AAD6YYL4_9AGAR|nr:hypothetical protein DFH08DRAFT_978887 [Mycena albidolilacea]